jgi:hypothetical protein
MARTTSTTTRKRRTATPAQKAASAASKAAANDALNVYAQLLLTDPAELDAFLLMAASIGVKPDPEAAGDGYSAQNVMLLCAQRRPISHCGGFAYWLERGRVVREGEKALMTFRRSGGKKEGESEEVKELLAEGYQTRPRKSFYYVKRGTFDIRQTAPIGRCLHCGTAPVSDDDRTTECPPTCEVFALRPGLTLDRDYVVAMAETQLAEGDPEE